jgi:hypothetical protein
MPSFIGAGRLSVIRRRHVIYVCGYDPQGAEGYYAIFERSWRRVVKLWNFQGTLSELHVDSEDFAHWDIEARGPNWQVSTRYEFLRQEQVIRANMAESMWRQAPRAILWTLYAHASGSHLRIMRGAWKYGLSLFHFQMMMIYWVLLAALGGAAAAWLVGSYLDTPIWVDMAVGAVAAIAVFMMLRPLADYMFVVQINSHWPYLVRYARGEPSCWDQAIEAGGARLAEVARAAEVDEIIVIGHSGGGITAPAVVARALELDADLGRHGPRVVLLTIGSIMPAIGVYRVAVKVRAIIERIAVEPSIRWIDTQSRKDIMNFWQFDPVGGIGIDVGERRCNPLIWPVRFSDMLTPERYRRLHLNYFRAHYQFLMANELRAPYDFFMVVAGPVAVEDWARRGRGIVAGFAEDATYIEPRMGWDASSTATAPDGAR